MNTIELHTLMLSDRAIHRVYGGVRPSNGLPLLKCKRPKMYICNTEPHNQPGQHWIAIYLPEERRPPEFFDPLGKAPQETFANFLIYNGPKYIFNTKVVQSSSSVYCGLYCLLFAFYRTRGYSIKKILSMFKDVDGNDIIVEKFFEENF